MRRAELYGVNQSRKHEIPANKSHSEFLSAQAMFPVRFANVALQQHLCMAGAGWCGVQQKEAAAEESMQEQLA